MKKQVNLPATVQSNDGKEYRVEGNLWENYGKSRLYVNVLFPGQPAQKIGYVDLLSGDVCFDKKGYVGTWAEKVAEKMTVN